MVRTRSRVERVGENDTSDDQDSRNAHLDRLAYLMERFLEQQAKLQADRPTFPPPPQPPPPPLSIPIVINDVIDVVGERFMKYKPPVFKGVVDSKNVEN